MTHQEKPAFVVMYEHAHRWRQQTAADPLTQSPHVVRQLGDGRVFPSMGEDGRQAGGA
jgi:hypothetical protein